MKLKSFGCSFIYGSDLADCPRRKRHPQSQLTWTALLAQHYGLEHTCHAWPGIGNLQIAEQVLSELAVDSSPTVYVIGWTWIDRYSYIDVDQWNTILPTDDTSNAQHYFKHLHSQYRDKLTTLINIKAVQDAVLAAGHRLIMTYMDELTFETEWHTTPAVKFLQNSVRPRMTKFDNQTFLDWARSNGHKISPGWHPLEDAHRAAAELIISYNLV